MGYDASFVNQVAELARAWPDQPWRPGFVEGAAVTAVCEWMERSASERRGVSVSEVATDATAP